MRSHQRDVDGVEHDLDAHQNADSIAVAQRAEEPDAEDDCAQHQNCLSVTIALSPPAPIMIAPTIATSKTTEAISKGST